jgi:hypothetical protein
VVNVLARRYGFAIDDIVDAIRVLDQLGLKTASVDRPLLLLAVDHMVTHDLTAYDAGYLALAEAADGQLVTLDQRLATAAGARALPTPTGGYRRAREAAASYNVDPKASQVWARYGELLAELRRRAVV